ncbi:MAG: ABC transporter substrate-binding protein [Clostridia bacterium]|nr:ABC transporter substrate-binding protein [Clostridia bacterium]
MKKITKILSIILTIVMVLGICACKNTEENNNQATTAQSPAAEKTTVRVTALKGPTGMGMAKLFKDSDDDVALNKYEKTIESDPTLVSAAVLKGDFDIAAVPTNLAATLFNKGADMQVLALNTLGVLYVLENGNTINSVEDLRGKTIYATGQASTPEYILNYILRSNGLEPGTDVTVEYFTEHAELVTQMVSNKVAIGMLPQPNVTTAMTKNSDLRIALDLTEEFNKVSDGKSDVVQGCIVVNKTFAKNNPDAVKNFLKDYEASVEYVNNNIDEAAEIIASYEIIPSAAIAKQAIPTCNICFITGDEMKSKLNDFLKVLFDANPKSVGGAMPTDEIYYAG